MEAALAEQFEMDLWKKELAVEEKVHGHNHLVVAETQGNIAAVYFSQGKHTEALELLKKELAVKENVLGHNHLQIHLKLFGEDSLHVAGMQKNIADIRKAQGLF